MRHSLFSLGIILALALVVTGCGGGDKKDDKPAPATNTTGSTDASKESAAVRTSGKTSHPSQEVVMKFLTEILKENTEGAFALFTPKAQQEYAKTNSALDPAMFKGMEFRITGSAPLPDGNESFFGVYVAMVADGESTETVWGVRKIGEEYRIANATMNYGDEYMELDFEDPAGTRSAWIEEATAQQASVNPQQNQSPAPQYAPPQFNAPGYQQPNTQQQQPQQTAQPSFPNFQ